MPKKRYVLRVPHKAIGYGDEPEPRIEVNEHEIFAPNDTAAKIVAAAEWEKLQKKYSEQILFKPSLIQQEAPREIEFNPK
jgi:hypothetical protein